MRVHSVAQEGSAVPSQTEAAVTAYHAEVVACCKRRDAESTKVRFGGRMVARFLGVKDRDDGTLRCIACGQIDDEPWHRPDLCFGLIGLSETIPAPSDTQVGKQPGLPGEVNQSPANQEQDQ